MPSGSLAETGGVQKQIRMKVAQSKCPFVGYHHLHILQMAMTVCALTPEGLQGWIAMPTGRVEPGGPLVKERIQPEALLSLVHRKHFPGR
jgi:hypothetical protein